MASSSTRLEVVMKVFSEDDPEESVPIEFIHTDDAYGPHIALRCLDCNYIHQRISFTVDELIAMKGWVDIVLANRRN